MPDKTVLIVMGDGIGGSRYIVAVFAESDIELAQKCAALIYGGVVEEHLLGVSIDDPGMDFYTITMSHDGRHKIDVSNSRLDGAGHRWTECAMLRTNRDDEWQTRKSFWRLTWRGYAVDAVDAIAKTRVLWEQITAGEYPVGVDYGAN